MRTCTQGSTDYRVESSQVDMTRFDSIICELILGSASPRRKKILSTLGIPFTVVAPDTEEIHDPSDPVRTVIHNATEKYRAIRALHPGAAIITADTLVWFDGQLIGKPADLAEAARFLRAFSARTQIVYTAVAMGMPNAQCPHSFHAEAQRRKEKTQYPSDPSDPTDLSDPSDPQNHCAPAPLREKHSPALRVEVSSVTFKTLSESAIQAYLEKTRPLDRAGAYDIDENGDLLIASYSGSRTNIIGLPLAPVRDWLQGKLNPN